MVKLRVRDCKLASDCALLLRRILPEHKRLARLALLSKTAAQQGFARMGVVALWMVKKRIKGVLLSWTFPWRPNLGGTGQSIEHLARAAWAAKDQLWLPVDAPAATGNPANRGGFPELVCTSRIETRVARSRPKS
jgi:hypothetical protein